MSSGGSLNALTSARYHVCSDWFAPTNPTPRNNGVYEYIYTYTRGVHAVNADRAMCSFGTNTIVDTLFLSSTGVAGVCLLTWMLIQGPHGLPKTNLGLLAPYLEGIRSTGEGQTERWA